MFFEEIFDENIKVTPSNSLESEGNFSPHNLDINWSYFNAVYGKTYARWRFHFYFILCILVVIGDYYPPLFIFAFTDIWAQIGFNSTDYELMTEDYFYDFNLLASEVRGGDLRLDVYIFFYYNMLGYVIYGICDEIDSCFCNDIYEHKYYLGVHSRVKEANIVFNKRFSKTIEKRGSKPFPLKVKINGRKVRKVPLFYKNFLIYRNKYNILYREKYLYNIFLYNRKITLLLHNKKFLKDFNIKYYYCLNKDRSFSWLDFNDTMAIKKPKR